MRISKKITWSDSYSVGIKEIDEQHKYLISLASELLESTKKEKKNRDKITDILGRIAAFSRINFATEEQYIDKLGCPDADKHKKEHKKLLKKIDELTTKQREEYDVVYSDLIKFLDEWISTHIVTEDRKIFQNYLQDKK